MDFDQMFPGKYMKAGQFKGRDVTLTIASVDLEEFTEGKEVEVRGILTFREPAKGTKQPLRLVLNKTNATAIKGMFGRETNSWVGKRVTFFPAAIEYGDSDLAIRVRGSPDLDGPKEWQSKIGRKNATFRMVKTGKGAAPGKAVTTIAPKSAPIIDVVEGETEEQAEARAKEHSDWAAEREDYERDNGVFGDSQ